MASYAIWDICIRRPVFTVMLVTAPMILGLVSYLRLGVDLLPNVDLVLVVVTTTNKGASVEEMESSITKPIEEAVNTVSGIDELRSVTREGMSQVIIGFVLEKDGNVAAQEVRDRLSNILPTLPYGTDPPIVERFNLESTPIMTLAVSGKGRSIQEVTEIAKKQLKENIESVHGVGSVILVGGRQRAINVIVDTDRLIGLELSIEEVRQALKTQNIEIPGGRVDQGRREKILRVIGRIESPEQFGDIIVAMRDGYPIRLRDVARVEDSTEEPRGLSRLDGENAISIVVQKQAGTNTVEVVDRVKERLKAIEPSLPPGIRTFIVRDQSLFIKESIKEVKFHLLLAGLLVAATIFLFIRDWRTTLIAAVALPTSLIATFSFMDVMGFTLNNMTMLGLILAVGVVIDDAVVVHENVFRHMEEYGKSAREAASSATHEIGLAVLATTLSLVVIFLPIAFMQGRVGRFFNSFGSVVAFAIMMSMLVSFTLTPMLCSRFLKLDPRHKTSKDDPVWRFVSHCYGGILAWSLRHRWVVVLATIGLFLSTPVLLMVVPKDFLPRDDQSEYEIDVILPEGISLQAADDLTAEIETKLRELRGVEHVFLQIGDLTGKAARGQGEVTRALFYIRLAPMQQRPFTQFDVMNDTRKLLAQYPDLRAVVQVVKPWQTNGFREVQIDLNLRGPDLDRLREYSSQITEWMRSRGHYVDVDTSLSLRNPELRVRIDREKAMDLGIPVETVANTMSVLVGGAIVTKYKEGDDQFDVWLRADISYRDKEESLRRLSVPSPRAGQVILSNLATLEEASGPSQIDRFGRLRQVVVSSNLEGIGMSEAVAELTAYVKSMNLPPEYTFEFLGQAKMLQESNDNFAIAFLLAFVFMYMILAAQFESFVHPITILLAVPLTLPFAIISLLMLRTALDIYAMIGLFMLFGIVKKNGILQVDYTNHLREKGIPRDQAILEANDTRLRPILMTTVMLVAAMIPIALGTGPGAGARASLAKVILGGQVLSLLLTLLVTPVAYSLWDDLIQWWQRPRRSESKATAVHSAPAKTSNAVVELSES